MHLVVIFDQFFSLVESALNHISNYYIFWLFYIGATILSLHYFVQRRWLKSILFFGLALLWSRVMVVFLQYVGGLGTDSFHEASNFNMEEDVAPAPVTVAQPGPTSVEVPTPGVVVIPDEKAEVKEEEKERVEDKNLQAVNLSGDIPKVNPVYLQQARDAAKESSFRLSHRARSDGGVAGAFLSSGAPKRGSDMYRGGIGLRGAKF